MITPLPSRTKSPPEPPPSKQTGRQEHFDFEEVLKIPVVVRMQSIELLVMNEAKVAMTA